MPRKFEMHTNWPKAITALVIAVTIVLCLSPGSSGSSDVVLPTNKEVRALWVVRTTLTSPEKFKHMIDSAAGTGFNTLIVLVRGRGDAYYRSRWEPRAIEL